MPAASTGSPNTTGAPGTTGTPGIPGAPGTPGTQSARLAGPGIRIGAFTIDVLLATLCTVAVALGIPSATSVTVTATLMYAIVPLCALAIYAILVMGRGASIGHRLAGLRVVDLDTHQRASSGRALGRTLIIFAPLLIALILRALAFCAPLAHVTLVSFDSDLGDALRIAALAAGGAVPVWWTILCVPVVTGRRALHDRAARTMVLTSTLTPAQG
jgi:uncharacterized RDD family membrane protein YckC